MKTENYDKILNAAEIELNSGEIEEVAGGFAVTGAVAALGVVTIIATLPAKVAAHNGACSGNQSCG